MPKYRKVPQGPHRPDTLYNIKEFPELNEIWGIYVGDGCVTGQDPLEWLEVDAHAHVLDEWNGWICIANPAKVVTPNGNPTQLVLHELAHILCKKPGHGKKWYDTICRLGAKHEGKKYYKTRTSPSIIVNEESNYGQNEGTTDND